MPATYSELISTFGRTASIYGGMERTVPFPPDELVKIEKDHHISFPKQYKDFATEIGGCMFIDTQDHHGAAFPWIDPIPQHISGGVNLTPVDIMFGSELACQEPDRLSWNIRTFYVCMPRSIVPIGNCFGNNLVCIGVDGLHSGKVYYWDAEMEPLSEADYIADYGTRPPSNYEWSNVHLVAQSFREFVSSIRFFQF
ncbi:MAG: SMI1/KNR4 family protein [Planctomycetota bacterium]|nr:SMI1/KNR4 family protein [Planctomycetota bacterium]